MNAHLPRQSPEGQNPTNPTSMVGGEQEQLLVQESAVPVVSSAADPSRPAVRLAHFLLPRAGGVHRPALPAPPRHAGPILADGLQIEFKGWAESSILWMRWVDKLRPRYEPLWRKVGILDAVLATTCRVRRDDGVMLQLAAIWSAETNTFLFPWGEATVTLEDVAVLGGLPLLGRPVRAPLEEGPSRGDLKALQAVLSALYRSKSQKPDHPAWAMRFLEPPPGVGPAARDGEAAQLLEHGAFLAMWLSLFVLPAPPFDVIRGDVLPIAARLARGGCVALAPAALASIYSDLSALNRYVNLDTRFQAFVGWAPLHILQLWVLARFPELRPEMAPTMDPVARRRPWAARWHEVHKEIDSRNVHAVFMSPEEFEWRPYGTSSFAPPPEKGCSWVHGRDIERSKQLLSFAQCLRSCELVGVRCIEQYNPHRVARQLGFDQDVPGSVARVNSNWEIAWGTYMMEPKNFAFIVPQYMLAVTVEYTQWWKPYSVECATAVANSAKFKEFRALVSPRGENMKVLHDYNASKEEAPVLVNRQNRSSEHGEVAHQHLVKGAVNTTSSKGIGSATAVHLQSIPEHIVVISDDESDGLMGNEHEVGTMPIEGNEKANKDASASNKQSGPLLEDCPVVNRESSGNNKMPSSNRVDPNTERPKRVLIEGNEKANKDTPASNKQSGPLLEDCAVVNRESSGNNKMSSSNPVDANPELPKRVPIDGNEYANKDTPASNKQSGSLLKDRVAVNRESSGNNKMSSSNPVHANAELPKRVPTEGNEKANKDASAPNKQPGPLLEDCTVVNRETSGNNKMFSCNPVDASLELPKRVISTNTLYYLEPFGRVKDAQNGDAAQTNADKGAYLPRREIGTREMIEEASAAREAEKVVLQKVIDSLKEEIAAAKVRFMDRNPSKT